MAGIAQLGSEVISINSHPIGNDNKKVNESQNWQSIPPVTRYRNWMDQVSQSVQAIVEEAENYRTCSKEEYEEAMCCIKTQRDSIDLDPDLPPPPELEQKYWLWEKLMKRKLQRAEEILHQKAENTKYIKLKVWGYFKLEVLGPDYFMVKATTKMGKFKKFYGERVGVPISSLRLGLGGLGGRRIHDEETIKDVALEMKQDENIYVLEHSR